MTTFAMWAAIRTVKSKVGTWVGFQQAREAGLDVNRSDWARHIGEARAALANRLGELSRPLNRRPVGTEIQQYTTVRQSGFLQHIDVFVRDLETGAVEARPYTIRTRDLRSRISVINEGLERYRNAIASDPDLYPEEVLGASYTGTYQMVPGGG